MTEKNGFTLIELAISIFILVVAIIGIYNSFSTVLVLTAGASSRFTAAYLAQEGIEIIRNIRDNNWIQGRGWNAGLLSCGNGCEADYKTGTPSQVTSLRAYPTGGNRLKIDSDNFYSYNPTGGSEVKFRRKITITLVGADVLKVFVLVTWKEKEEDFDFEAEEYLYDWYRPAI